MKPKKYRIYLRLNEVYVIIIALKKDGNNYYMYLKKYVDIFEKFKKQGRNKNKKIKINISCKNELIDIIFALHVYRHNCMETGHDRRAYYDNGDVIYSDGCRARNCYAMLFPMEHVYGCYWCISEYVYNYLTRLCDKWFDTKHAKF